MAASPCRRAGQPPRPRSEESLLTKHRDRPPLRGDHLFEVNPVGQHRGGGALVEAELMTQEPRALGDSDAAIKGLLKDGAIDGLGYG